MARYQVILAYDGTLFKGFQRQSKARTVQGVVETALHQLGWTGNAILAAGRTDTGVHASGQVIAFDLDWQHPQDELRLALNAQLPDDVAVKSVRLADPGFHPRYDAVARTYRYHIVCLDVRDPLIERYAWRVWPQVDLNQLQCIAQSLPGKHDFAAFGTPPRLRGSTWRTVFQAEWSGQPPEFIFEIAADAFLYRMVRRLVSLQVEIAQGKRGNDLITRYLETPPALPIQGLAPPHGLSLVSVTYETGARITTVPDEELDQELSGYETRQ